METKKVKQVCIGQLAIDDIIIWNKMSQYNRIGGSALYSSLGMALWKDLVGIVGKVGSDYDMVQFKKLIPSNLVPNIIIDGETSRRLWVLHDENNEHYFVPKYSSLSDTACAPRPHEISEAFIRDADLFHICPFPVEYQSELAKFLKSKKKIVTVDPDAKSCSDRPKLHEFDNLFQNVDVFLPSEIEIDSLLGIDEKQTKTDDYLLEVERFVDYYNIKVCVLKRGEKGIFLYDRTKNIRKKCKAIQVNVVDSTGAGDAFSGGFGYAYKFNRDSLSAVHYGLISAAFSVVGIGIEKLLEVNRGGQVL